MSGLAALSSRGIRVLIVDDSIFMRHSLERLLSGVPGVTVVGAAVDGVDGVKLALELRPDVITMDVDMPRMDGVTAVAEIMKTVPTPIVMVSAVTTAGADATIRALDAGAVEFVTKPSGVSHELANVGNALAEAVRRASLSHARRKHPRTMHTSAPEHSGAKQFSRIPSSHVVVVGASTGGPPALTEVIPRLPADFSAGVLVVQHMPAGFTAALARRLDSLSALTVTEAVDGDVVSAGRVLVAPGDFHMTVGADRRVHLDERPALHGVRPSVDLTLQSLPEVYGRKVSVAILTGMGRDGAEGCAQVEQAGGEIITQDEGSCVVYGMPRVAKERTQRSREAPIEQIAALLAASTVKRR